MDETRDTPTRRRFLSRTAAVGLVGVAATGGLAGCLGENAATSTGGSGDDGSGGGDSTGGDGGAETATPTPTGLQLETFSVAGSPGEPMVVKPAGEPALLDFFATWCAPCKAQMKELRTVRSEHPDFHMLSVSREKDADLIRGFWQEYQGTWPVAQDTQLEAFQEYGITRIPTMVILDAAGEEVWRHSGLSAAADIIEKVREAQA